jgi:predicted DNA-binding antitoxin AbrB/MazE fold protein
MAQPIEAVYENGVFRPLQPVHLPEHQRVEVHLPATGTGVGEVAEFDGRFPMNPCPQTTFKRCGSSSASWASENRFRMSWRITSWTP